ncbi:MAG: hypothetical protein DRJ69_03175 [Thermoprotei archaeon]|nr:MAG: hypothetical protein DRJ69_03175 [Thermoprotei archaeon]
MFPLEGFRSCGFVKNLYSKIVDFPIGMIRREQYLLMLLNVGRSELPPEMEPIQIMKSLFLYAMKYNPKDFYHFEPGLYGPISYEVYEHLRKLISEDLIMTKPAPGKSWPLYTLTSKGKRMAEELGERYPGVASDLLKVKKEVMKRSFLDLLHFIYSRYPNYASKSIIRFPQGGDR